MGSATTALSSPFEVRSCIRTEIPTATKCLTRSLQRDAPASMRCEITRRLAVNYFNRADPQGALTVLLPASDDAELAEKSSSKFRPFTRSHALLR